MFKVTLTRPYIQNNAILNLIALLPRKLGQQPETKMADVIQILDEKLLSNSHYNNPEGFFPDWYISLLSFVEMYPVWYRLGGSKLKRACGRKRQCNTILCESGRVIT